MSHINEVRLAHVVLGGWLPPTHTVQSWSWVILLHLFTHTNSEPLQALQIISFHFKNNLNFRYIKKRECYHWQANTFLPQFISFGNVEGIWEGMDWTISWKILKPRWKLIGWVEITYKSSGICWHIQIREIILFLYLQEMYPSNMHQAVVGNRTEQLGSRYNTSNYFWI